MDRLTLRQIEGEVTRLASLIGAPRSKLPTFGRSEDFARPHIEVDTCGYHFVVVERGQEFERITTDELDELLYRIFDGVTFSMASDFELTHRYREGNRDCRRVLFSKQVELLHHLSPSWAEREAEDHRRILRRHPFVDRDEPLEAEPDRTLLADGSVWIRKRR